MRVILFFFTHAYINMYGVLSLHKKKFNQVRDMYDTSTTHTISLGFQVPICPTPTLPAAAPPSLLSSTGLNLISSHFNILCLRRSPCLSL